MQPPPSDDTRRPNPGVPSGWADLSLLFTSALFLSRFLPVILAIAWVAEAARLRQVRGLSLLLGSLIFYAFWRSDHLPVLIGSIGFNYLLGSQIVSAKPEARRRLVVGGVAGNLLLLGAFKYAGFFAANAEGLFGDFLGMHGVVPQIALPLGISFFTFTQIAYLVDCAKGRRGQHGLVEYALFVTFFPHLLAGPIIHHSELIPQFQGGPRPFGVALSDMAEGFALLAVGAAKKLLLADPLAPISDASFNLALLGGPLDPGQAWIGALAYTFQLYFDFSGYSDMAVGLARVFGIRFPANFDSPYRATSIIDFWRRWHMTLSRWLRDYLYIPLGGSRGGAWSRHANLMMTMLLGGLWHGAHWNFVIWGGLHGMALVVNHVARTYLRWPDTLLGHFLSGAATFLFVVCAWVFFRATTTISALGMFGAMWSAQPGAVLPAFVTAEGALLALAAAVAFLAPNSIAIERALASRRPVGLLAGAVAGAGAGAALLAGLAAPAPAPFLYFNF